MNDLEASVGQEASGGRLLKGCGIKATDRDVRGNVEEGGVRMIDREASVRVRGWDLEGLRMSLDAVNEQLTKVRDAGNARKGVIRMNDWEVSGDVRGLGH